MGQYSGSDNLLLLGSNNLVTELLFLRVCYLILCLLLIFLIFVFKDMVTEMYSGQILYFWCKCIFKRSSYDYTHCYNLYAQSVNAAGHPPRAVPWVVKKS